MKNSKRIMNVLQKLAYVPLTPAAQEAMPPQGGGMPPMDPAMAGGAGAPPMPMDPSMGSGMPMPPPQQGGAGIQTVPGPNGEPVDPETGFIVVDPANGVELEPMTGLLFIKPAGQFVTPEGQPVPMEQATQMIEAAMSQGGGMPPMDPAMAGGAGAPPMPMDPSMGSGMPPQGAPEMAGGMPPMDPAAMQMASGGPMVDPQSGLPLDPSTGMFAPTPAQGAEMGAGTEGGLAEAMPGFEEFIDKYDQTVDRQDKLNKRILHDMSGTRTDIQGLRREMQQLNDNQDTLVARLENLLNLIEARLTPGARPDGTTSGM